MEGGASGVRGPGLHLRLESEELVAFLGFSQGFTALVGVGVVEAIGIWGGSRARLPTLSGLKSV